MFYEHQPVEQQEAYKEMLRIVGSLSNIFSDSDKPMIYYRAHENIFCKYFEADNLSREDCSADAAKGNIGIGLKTWVGRDDQKVAEFGELRPTYEALTGIDLVARIAEYRNERIRVTKNLHGIQEMIYHVLKRDVGSMMIYECAFDMIDIPNIVIDETRGNVNNTYFSDGNHTYHFSTSKNTLYMIFDDMDLMDSFDVKILDDPYEILKQLFTTEITEHRTQLREILTPTPSLNQLCLRLYSMDNSGSKFVAEKSGLNQWNGVRTSNRKRGDGSVDHVETPRNPDEFYIPYPAEDRIRKDFFPPRDTNFQLRLPDGKWISAKVCQAAFPKWSEARVARLTQEECVVYCARQLQGKAIMSNPNSELGKWLLRDVFELPYGTKVTYDMLQIFGVDSVMFTKLDELKYAIDFCNIGTYEQFYGLEESDK